VSSDKDAEMVRLTDEIERLTNERNQSNDENRKNEESLKKTKAGVYATIFIGFISIISIAVMHYYKGDYAHARADWEKVLRINPSDKVVQGDLESLQRMSYLSSVPDFVNDAYIKASEDMLIGIGTYKIGADASKMSTGMIFAQTRARADIARQLDSIIKNMIADYVATSKLDPTVSLSFQESVAQALSKADLKGAKVVASQIDSDGLLWVVMEYSKSAAVNDYSAATAAGKLAVPAAAAFDPLSRMDACFSKAASGGPVIVGD
jgi:tetratricopeptide (TPR) repeat protein